jgi:hypothetical protein
MFCPPKPLNLNSGARLSRWAAGQTPVDHNIRYKSSVNGVTGKVGSRTEDTVQPT